MIQLVVVFVLNWKVGGSLAPGKEINEIGREYRVYLHY